MWWNICQYRRSHGGAISKPCSTDTMPVPPVFEHISRWCDLSVGPDARLIVTFRVPELSFDALHTVAARLGDSRLAPLVQEIVLDFGDVEAFTTPWTAIVARLIDLHRRAPCRVCGLHGQPASVAALYRMNRQLAALLLGDSSREPCEFTLRAG